ncbi:RNA-binding protein CP33, chloroplastic [Iris pallida]|uniref:RNA-binding protein CP33, chloroplastic n=1 Tax=Iris pallida TaxID=29817 RepID=A0AAX6HMF1_IRIPA|nr:RNA-binding protein CP33, chloroplastic [Iris pallida]KAJ6842180.1 RNA-binding protein CP33, chloroplastic [Iris pallida]
MATATSVTSAASLHRIAALPSLSVTLSIPKLVSFSIPTILQKTLPKPLLIKSPPKLLSSSLFSSASSSLDAGPVDSDEEVLEEDEEEEEEELRSPPGDSGRLYVGNLPYTMTPSQLSDIFSQAGTVNTVEIVYDRVTNRSRGFAFVTMANTEEANKAIRMFNGSQVGGRTVKVNFPEVPRGGEREVMGPRTRSVSRGYIDSPYKVYAGNLGWTLTSEALKDAFSMQPGLLDAKVIYERDSGRSRGYGFVSFSSAEDAQSAIEALNGKEVGGRPLRLNLASQRFSSVAVPLQVSEPVDTANSPSDSSLA